MSIEIASNGSATEGEWHYELGGNRLGPVTEGAMLLLIADRKLTRGSFIWKKGMPDWVTLDSTIFSSQFSNTPPPLTGAAISNTLIWWLAFAPLLGIFIAGFLAGATHKNISDFWWTTLVLNLALSMADERKLKRAGHDTEKMGGAWIVPVYMFKRAQVLKQNNAYFIVWLVLFCLSLFSDM